MLIVKRLLYKILQSLLVSTGDLTKVSSNISAFEFATYIKFGRVCVVRLNFTVGTTISNSTETLFSGAPAPAVSVRTTLTRTNTKNTDHARIGITGNGIIQNQYTSSGLTIGQYEGELVYITKD